MAKISEIMSDMDKVENGVWEKYSAGIELLIANINNTKYRKARSRLLKPHMRRLKFISADEILDLIKPAAAKHLLIGWKNIEDEKGNPIPYSPEKALEFFNDPKLVDLYNFVLEIAGENTAFAQELKEEAGND